MRVFRNIKLSLPQIYTNYESNGCLLYKLMNEIVKFIQAEDNLYKLMREYVKFIQANVSGGANLYKLKGGCPKLS